MACIIFYSAVLQCGIPLPFSRILSAFIVLSAVISCSWWLSFRLQWAANFVGAQYVWLDLVLYIACLPQTWCHHHRSPISSGCSFGCHVLPILQFWLFIWLSRFANSVVVVVGSAVTFCQFVLSVQLSRFANFYRHRSSFQLVHLHHQSWATDKPYMMPANKCNLTTSVPDQIQWKLINQKYSNLNQISKKDKLIIQIIEIF